MGGNHQVNSMVIRRAFDRLRDNKDRIIEEGMIRLAKAGLDYLVDVHNQHELFMEHVTETNTMAWAVSHDGRVVASGHHEGNDDDMPGTAEQTASSILSSTSGWVAILLSEMEGYYRVDYEEDFLFDTEFNTASEFQTYFKRIN